MTLISTNQKLEERLEELKAGSFITVDTEFIRETSFWPKLCVIQLASAGTEPVLIDALSSEIRLEPVFQLMADTHRVKVFHAARQDIEIFYHLSGNVPAPIFDTQLAAMVLGYGDSIGYDALVSKICKKTLDKSHRYTDWARRPLTPRQLTYAAGDVTYLRDIYVRLNAELARCGREHWLREEMDILTDPRTYAQAPHDAWRRLKFKPRNARQHALMIAAAAWRESEAQTRNVPRKHVLKDEAIGEIATQAPLTPQDLVALRSISSGFARSEQAARLLAEIVEAKQRDPATLPELPKPTRPNSGHSAMTGLLKVLLKHICDQANVAHRLVATVDDLDHIAEDDNAPVPALSGWRRALFGEAALKLKRGDLALSIKDGHVHLHDITTNGS